MIFEIYYGGEYMASAATYVEAMEKAIREAYMLDLIGVSGPRVSEGEFERTATIHRMAVASVPDRIS